MKKLIIAAAALMFAACDEQTVAVEDMPLEGTTWKLVELNGEANPAFGENDCFYFTLDNNSITGKGSVNRFFGGYEITDEGALDIGELGMTRMMGPNIDLENSFVQMFDNISGCTIDGNTLTLKIDDKVVARFEAEENAGEDEEKPAEEQSGTPKIGIPVNVELPTE